MNWMDEGTLYSSISLFLREDLGRGDLTTQATIARNTRARGRFLAGEKMIVAGLEAAEEVFITLDPQQQIEAFAADGEEVEAGKVIARAHGFADVMLAGERVALNLLQHLSGIATLTREYVRAVEGTAAQIVDTRKTTPGLRMLEKYAVLLGGGRNHRYGLDDGVFVKANHTAIAGGVGTAVKAAGQKIAPLRKIAVQISHERDLREAIENGADVLSIEGLAPEETARLVTIAREVAPKLTLEASGRITLENVREYARAGVDLISVGALTQSVRAMDISFQMQAG
ncbi:MAG TPA: carboxylating nicotinate-nucleotide diphosphorylase [Pyrinomonadaceae bacterium]|jgi:nicotinate-nucleotide pyrophosphorylase (carboxylating)